MRHVRTLFLLETVSVLLLIVGWGVVSAASPEVVVTFEEIHELFGIDGRYSTDLQKEEAWKQYKGRCVEWTGELNHLSEGWFGGLTIGMKHLDTTLTYDVLIDAPSSLKNKLLRWHKGERYTYRGQLVAYGGAILAITVDWGCGRS